VVSLQSFNYGFLYAVLVPLARWAGTPLPGPVIGGRIGGMHTTRLEYQIMLIISQIESPWLKTAGPALASIGRAEPVLPGEALDRLRESPYDLVLIEATDTSEGASLVAQLHNPEAAYHPSQGPPRRWPAIVVIAKAPTWQEAREVLWAGAADYWDYTLDGDKLVAACREVLDRLGK